MKKIVNERLSEYFENKISTSIQCGLMEYKRLMETKDWLKGNGHDLLRFGEGLRPYLEIHYKGRHTQRKTCRVHKSVFSGSDVRNAPCEWRGGGEGASSSRKLNTEGPLRATVIALKINSLAAEISSEVFAFTFVENLLVAYYGEITLKHSTLCRRQWMALVNRRIKMRSSFRSAKTKVMKFYKASEKLQQMDIYMKGTKMPHASMIKFLGVHWDTRLILVMFKK